NVAAGPAETGDETFLDWIVAGRKYDRQGRSDLLRYRCRTDVAGDRSDWQANEFGHELGQPIVVTLGWPKFDGDVLTLHETPLLQALPKCTHKRSRIVERSASKERDYRYRLLRPRRERPRNRRAAEERDEPAALDLRAHSITSSASASSLSGIWRP